MNSLFAGMVAQHTPKFNPDIVNGLACLYVPLAPDWLKGVFKSAAKSFPKGLTFEDCERCTPYEEFAEATKLRGNKRTFDLAESDLFLVKLKFSFENDQGVKERLADRFMYLPFVNEAGIFRLGGTMFHVTGVLSDKVISPGPNSVFVKLMRDKLIFRHVGHSVMVDDQRETHNVVWANIYRKPDKEKAAPETTNAESSIVHYLFARYGFRQAFRKFAGFIPTVGKWQSGMVQNPDTIICRSAYYGTTRKPSSHMGYNYKPSDLYIEIPKDKWNTQTRTLVSGFFYVVDHFPDRFEDFDERVQSEPMEPVAEDIYNNRIMGRLTWTILLGHIIFSAVYSESRLYDNIQEHFASLDNYLDEIVQIKLREINWHVNDFYELIARIASDFQVLLLGGQFDVNSMYNKNIEILYYMLSEIAFKIFKVNYQLRKSRSKKPLTAKTVNEALNKNMTPRAIFHLSKSKQIVEAVSYCGDHKYPKLTSKISEQESGSSKFKKKPKRVVLGPQDHLHPSMLEGGSVLFISKSNPKPNTRINPYAKINLVTGSIIPDPEFAEDLANLNALLTKTNSSNPEDLGIELVPVDLDPDESVEEPVEIEIADGSFDIEETDVEVE